MLYYNEDESLKEGNEYCKKRAELEEMYQLIRSEGIVSYQNIIGWIIMIW